MAWLAPEIARPRTAIAIISVAFNCLFAPKDANQLVELEHTNGAGMVHSYFYSHPSLFTNCSLT